MDHAYIVEWIFCEAYGGSDKSPTISVLIYDEFVQVFVLKQKNNNKVNIVDNAHLYNPKSKIL